MSVSGSVGGRDGNDHGSVAGAGAGGPGMGDVDSADIGADIGRGGSGKGVGGEHSGGYGGRGSGGRSTSRGFHDALTGQDSWSNAYANAQANIAGYSSPQAHARARALEKQRMGLLGNYMAQSYTDQALARGIMDGVPMGTLRDMGINASLGRNTLGNGFTATDLGLGQSFQDAYDTNTGPVQGLLDSVWSGQNDYSTAHEKIGNVVGNGWADYDEDGNLGLTTKGKLATVAAPLGLMAAPLGMAVGGPVGGLLGGLGAYALNALAGYQDATMGLGGKVAGMAGQMGVPLAGQAYTMGNYLNNLSTLEDGLLAGGYSRDPGPVDRTPSGGGSGWLKRG